MILTCPNCATQYVVKDGAIPPQGRQVRCAACKHSWHQDPDENADLVLDQEVAVAAPAIDAEDAPAEVPAMAEPPNESLAEATMIDPRSGPEAEERAFEETTLGEAPADEAPRVEEMLQESSPSVMAAAPADNDAPPEPEAQVDDEFSPFAARDAVERKRRSPLLAILALVVLIAALAAAFWFYAPAEWKAKLGLAETTTPLQLSNPPHVERRPLASGQELLTVAGRVINPTDQAHPVPPIYAELYDHGGKVIYSWTIAPPTPTLGPGASASFNSAEINVPAGAEGVTISLGPPKA
jgi:predicted Zn finger-like uncharacterized protein